MGVEGEIDPAEALTRPRPGHADLVGAQKYGFDDVRNVLERASARETAARVDGRRVLPKASSPSSGVEVLSHVVRIGSVKRRPARRRRPRPEDLDGGRPLAGAMLRRGGLEARWWREIDAVRKARDTVGGVFEVLAYGCPAGPRVARALRPQARRAARPRADEHPVGEGRGGRRRVRDRGQARVEGARRDRARRGRRDRPAHDARAGGIEGGMSTGEPIRVRAAMKPFSTVPKPLATVDIASRRGRGRDQAAHRRLRGAGGRRRRRGGRGLRARRRRAGEVRRRFAARDAREPGRYVEGLA